VLAEGFERRRLMIATNLLCLVWQAGLVAVVLTRVGADRDSAWRC
jgi:hypothetical protein